MSTGFRDAFYESQFIYTPKGRKHAPDDTYYERPADEPTRSELRAEGDK